MIRGLPASVPARGLDPWRRPKGSWALGTRMCEDLERPQRLAQGACAVTDKSASFVLSILIKFEQLQSLR